MFLGGAAFGIFSPLVQAATPKSIVLATTFVSQYVRSFQPGSGSVAIAEEDSSKDSLKSTRLPAYATKRTFAGIDILESTDPESQRQLRNDLKQKLFAQCATCDRGFGAVAADRDEINRIVQQLRKVSPIQDPTRNIYPKTTSPLDDTPIEGAWKMVYTSSQDVLSLAANPLAIVQGIHQILYRDGSSVNVIDLAPRAQALLPQGLVGDGSVLRLKVFTKVFARDNSRLGLSFRRVEFKPLTLFSQPVNKLLPPVSTVIPTAALFGPRNGADEIGLLYEKNTPNYCDVLYLDGDTLVVQQASPGGLFVCVRSTEPIDSFM